MSHCVRRAGYVSTVQINCRRVVALQNLCECLLWEETEVPVPRFCPLVDSPTCEEPRGGSQAPVGSCVTSVLCCECSEHTLLLFAPCSAVTLRAVADLPSQSWQPSEGNESLGINRLWWSCHWQRSCTLLRTIADELPVCREVQNTLPDLCKNEFSLRSIWRLPW